VICNSFGFHSAITTFRVELLIYSGISRGKFDFADIFSREHSYPRNGRMDRLLMYLGQIPSRNIRINTKCFLFCPVGLFFTGLYGCILVQSRTSRSGQETEISVHESVKMLRNFFKRHRFITAGDKREKNRVFHAKWKGTVLAMKNLNSHADNLHWRRVFRHPGLEYFSYTPSDGKHRCRTGNGDAGPIHLRRSGLRPGNTKAECGKDDNPDEERQAIPEGSHSTFSWAVTGGSCKILLPE
jgi:hypothetical protein